jgi:hypothetical protein
MRSVDRSIRRLAATVLVALGMLAASAVGSASAMAFEVHEPLEPPFGTFPERLFGLAVGLPSGNVYAGEFIGGGGSVKVFGPEGEAPVGGGPASFTGAGSFGKSFIVPFGVAVDNACYLQGLSGSACTSFDASSGDIYISDSEYGIVDKYQLNSSSEYEYLCEFWAYDIAGSACLPEGGESEHRFGQVNGVVVDAAGDAYIATSHGDVYEFNAAGEERQKFAIPNIAVKELTYLAVSRDGTVYVLVELKTGVGAVVELKRSSLTGAVEGEPALVTHTEGATGVAFDQETGQLFVDLGSSGEALNAAHEVVSTFGPGVISSGGAVAVNEATGDVYVANGATHRIDRFGPGVVAMAPAVNETAPAASSVTRTTVLVSGTVNTGDAASGYDIEYVDAAEYAPAAGNPYGNGETTQRFTLAPGSAGVSVGPLPLTGLLAGTTYHYRIVASNEVGTTYGPDHTFTTAAATPPAVSTGAAGEVTQTTVALSGVVEPQGLQTSYEFEVGTDTTYGGAKLFGNAGRSAGSEAVSATLQYLVPGVTYHYRLVATNEDGTSYGQDMTFTTPGVPSLITQPPTTALIPSPTVQFPSVAGAITKPQGSDKGSKKKTKVKKKKAKGNKKHAKGKQAKVGKDGFTKGGEKGK